MSSGIIPWDDLLLDGRIIGRGAMCECYRAISSLEGGTVVIKKPRPRNQEDETMYKVRNQQLRNETMCLSQLQHPHIVRFIGSGVGTPEGKDERFLVLEYLANGTLAKLIEQRRKGKAGFLGKGDDGAGQVPHFVDATKNTIPLAKVMRWAEEMASALDYMHRTASKTHTYVWRDLKPDNIGFTANETLKIFDFGMTRRRDRGRRVALRGRGTMESGTLLYMAPEAALGEVCNEKVDVYAWSHVVAHMLSLQRPYIQLYIKSEADFFQSVVHGGRRPYVSPRWPRRLRKLLQLSWVRDPKKRPSFEDILNGKILEEAAGFGTKALGEYGNPQVAIQISQRSRPAAPPLDALEEASPASLFGAPLGPPPDLDAQEHRLRGRSATVDVSDPFYRRGDLFEARSGDPGLMAAPEIVEAGAHIMLAEEHGGRDEPAPRWIRIGPLFLPFCFFGAPNGNRSWSKGEAGTEKERLKNGGNTRPKEKRWGWFC